MVALALCLATAVTLILLRLPPTALGAEFRSEAGGFALRVPKGWATTTLEPPGEAGVYLRSADTLLVDGWARAGISVARWEGNGWTTGRSGSRDIVQREVQVDGYDAIRVDLTTPSAGPLSRVPRLSVRVVEFYVFGVDHTYRFVYWSYPPHLTDADIDMLVSTIQVFDALTEHAVAEVDAFEEPPTFHEFSPRNSGRSREIHRWWSVTPGVSVDAACRQLHVAFLEWADEGSVAVHASNRACLIKATRNGEDAIAAVNESDDGPVAFLSYSPPASETRPPNDTAPLREDPQTSLMEDAPRPRAAPRGSFPMPIMVGGIGVALNLR